MAQVLVPQSGAGKKLSSRIRLFILVSLSPNRSTLFVAMRMNTGISDWSGLYKQWSKVVEHQLMEQ